MSNGSTHKGWQDLLEAAQAELAETERRVKDLKMVVKIFRINVETNQPFPETGGGPGASAQN